MLFKNIGIGIFEIVAGSFLPFSRYDLAKIQFVLEH